MIRTDLIASIPALLERQARARGDKIAYRDAHRAVTYAALRTETGNLAGHLAAMGVAPGDSVALFLPNSVDWVSACFAINRADAVAVPISYDATLPEVAYRLVDATCRVVITTDERAAMVTEALAEVPGPTALILVERGDRADGHPRFAALAASAPPAPARDSAALAAPAFIVYTSGTTGRAKGVVLSVHSLMWVTAACWAPIYDLSERDTILSPLPLFHSYALSLSVLTILAIGATEVICERFSTREVLAHLAEGHCTVMPGVPTMFHYLLQAGTQADVTRFPGLRLCISAGAIMPATLNRAFEERFGVMLLDGYGITETSTMVATNFPVGGRVLGSCGIPIPGLAVRIVDLAGRDVPTGQEGELIIRGPSLMSGYHNKPAETAAALRAGWYHTGDLAKSDENGFLTITGRLKELIIRGGQNIAPAEIEEAASQFPAVLDCAVIGIAHAELGEVPVIFVVPREGASWDEAAFLAHCRDRLSGYKIPQAVHLTDQIPRTGSGKIMRFRLKERLPTA